MCPHGIQTSKRASAVIELKCSLAAVEDVCRLGTLLLPTVPGQPETISIKAGSCCETALVEGFGLVTLAAALDRSGTAALRRTLKQSMWAVCKMKPETGLAVVAQWNHPIRTLLAVDKCTVSFSLSLLINISYPRQQRVYKGAVKTRGRAPVRSLRKAVGVGLGA